MLPEDPFSSFYVREEGEEEEGEIVLGADDEPAPPPPRPTPAEGRGAQGPEAGVNSSDGTTRPPPPLNQSVAGAARDRAEQSLHVIDEFNRTQEEADQLLALELEMAEHPSTAFPPSPGPSPPSYDQQLRSKLYFLAVSANRYQLITALDTLRPRHVVMYSQDIVATRLIETFKAVNEEHPLELYSLMYEESSEEERYLSSVQHETEATEALIREQALLMVPREFDVARDSVSQLRRLTMAQQQGRRADSRRGLTSAQILDEQFEAEMRPMVVVDMREFNSELPTVLYRRGVDLEAATLEVGDYVLSPQICCERKSLDDLAQSLANGRLFKQIEQMTGHYERCVLLVESTEKYRNRRVINAGPFQGELSRRGRETRSLLCLLVRTFPRLHILWSVSPAHSAELFEELKLDQPNPSVETALAKKRDRFGAGPGADPDSFEAAPRPGNGAEGEEEGGGLGP